MQYEHRQPKINMNAMILYCTMLTNCRKTFRVQIITQFWAAYGMYCTVIFIMMTMENYEFFFAMVFDLCLCV